MPASSSRPSPDTGYATAWAAFPQGADAKAIAEDLKKRRHPGAQAGSPPTWSKRNAAASCWKTSCAANSGSGLAQLWTDAVAVKGLRSPEEEVGMLQKVDAPSVNDARRAPARLRSRHHPRLSPSAGDAAGQGGQAFGAPESFSSTPQKAVELPAWARDALAKLPHPMPLFTPSVFDPRQRPAPHRPAALLHARGEPLRRACTRTRTCRHRRERKG